MINRALIRQKVVQILYSYFLRGNSNVDAAEKELLFSLSKAFELYNFLLALMPEIMYYASNRIELRRAKLQPTYDDLHPNMRFVENAFINQLAANSQLEENRKDAKYSWRDNEDFVHRLFEQIEASPLYESYMSAQSTTYEEDRDFWRKIYKSFIVDNDELDELLESLSLYWNDDKAIIDTFVLKTIKHFEEGNGAQQPLLSEFRDDDDLQFATKLLRKAILNAADYQKLIDDHSQNWDKDRIAFMDYVILTAAITEIVTFPNIPTSVSLNEYIEIAKYYSTPKSSSFINGIADAVVKKLQQEGKLTKNV